VKAWGIERQEERRGLEEKRENFLFRMFSVVDTHFRRLQEYVEG